MGDRRERETEERHAGADGPGQQQAGADAQGGGARRRFPGQGPGEQRPAGPLDEQERQRGGGEAGEQDCRCDAEDVSDAVAEQGVTRRVERRPDRPVDEHGARRYDRLGEYSGALFGTR